MAAGRQLAQARLRVLLDTERRLALGTEDRAAVPETDRERFGVEAETYAAHAYDGMNLMLWTTPQAAGLNRAKIRDLIAHLAHPWPGVTGDIVFSVCLDDVGDTTLARYENGQWTYHTRQALQVPPGCVSPRDRLNRDASR